MRWGGKQEVQWLKNKMENREQSTMWIHFPAQAVVLVHVVVWGLG